MQLTCRDVKETSTVNSILLEHKTESIYVSLCAILLCFFFCVFQCFLSILLFSVHFVEFVMFSVCLSLYTMPYKAAAEKTVLRETARRTWLNLPGNTNRYVQSQSALVMTKRSFSLKFHELTKVHVTNFKSRYNMGALPQNESIQYGCFTLTEEGGSFCYSIWGKHP